MVKDQANPSFNEHQDILITKDKDVYEKFPIGSVNNREQNPKISKSIYHRQNRQKYWLVKDKNNKMRVKSKVLKMNKFIVS